MIKQDDWLEQELKYESRISHWDLDDNASTLRIKHEDNCERDEVRLEHEAEHRSRLRPSYERMKTGPVERPVNNPQRSVNPTQATKSIALSIIGFTMFFIVMVFVMILSDFSSGFMPVVFTFLPLIFIAMILSIIFNSIKRR